MSISVDVEIQGLEELDEALSDFSDKVAKKLINSALSVGATPIIKEAKTLASVAPEPHEMTISGNRVFIQPGLLKSSIRRRRLKKSELAKINSQAGIAIYIGKGTKQKIFPRYWYFVEFGTAKMSAVPFLRPAFDRKKMLAIERFKRKLAQNIAKQQALEAMENE